jgi:hypothetical protein
LATAAKPSVILIFGESDNDRAALQELFRAFRPDLEKIRVRPRRQPLVLMKKDNLPETRRKTTDSIAALVRAEAVSMTVKAVIAHTDCDAIEPAHESLAETIEAELEAGGVPNPIAAIPAWEIEAWWMLFPAAIAATRPCWAKVDYANRHVGSIANAKEVLRRDLRPKSSRARDTCPDFAESDGIRIALKIREMSLQGQPCGKSGSFERFARKIRDLA